MIHTLTKLGVLPINCSQQWCKDWKSVCHTLNATETKFTILSVISVLVWDGSAETADADIHEYNVEVKTTINGDLCDFLRFFSS